MGNEVVGKTKHKKVLKWNLRPDDYQCSTLATPSRHAHLNKRTNDDYVYSSNMN